MKRQPSWDLDVDIEPHPFTCARFNLTYQATRATFQRLRLGSTLVFVLHPSHQRYSTGYSVPLQ